jgi:hypothetical protein
MHYLNDFEIRSSWLDNQLYLWADRADLFCDSRVNVFLHAAMAQIESLSMNDLKINNLEFSTQLTELESQKVLLIISSTNRRASWRLLGRD